MIEIRRNPQRPRGYVLSAECVVERTIDEVFEFFSDALNLERLTPALLNFHVLTPTPIEMRQGQTIDYRLRLHGLPLRWRSAITVWEPPFRFVDEQLRGPYRYWHHLHTFEPTADGTIVRDEVHYGVPGGALIHWLLVKRDVQKIFTYRQQVLGEIFPSRALQPAQMA